MSGDEGAESNAERAQTLPDFVIAMAVFLIAVGFVVAFVPQLTAPYEEQEQPLVAERVANHLAGDVLAESAGSSRLNESCTRAFFQNEGAAGCPVNATTDPSDLLGVESHYTVNVTLERNVSGDSDTEVLCADGGTIGPCGSDRLAFGPDVREDDKSVAVARRTVHVDGAPAVLEVRVWS